MNPRDTAAQGERKRAEVLLGGLPPMSDAIRKAAINVRRFREPLDFNFKWIGWLSRDANNSWTVITFGLEAETGDLTVIAKAPGGAAAEPATIGALEKGVVRLHSGSSNGMLAGKPVFLRTKLHSSK